jgi:hypothetical protein
MEKSHQECQAFRDSKRPDLERESQECTSHICCLRIQMHIDEEMLALKWEQKVVVEIAVIYKALLDA